MKTNREFNLHNGQTGAAIAVRITTRASKNEISGILEDGTIKIKLTAAPVDGKANQMLIEFLSKLLDCPKSSIEIVAGNSGRDKLITITDLNSDLVQQKILASIQ